MRVMAAVLTGCVVVVTPVGGQQRAPADGGWTVSLGQPRTWQGTTGVATGWRFRPGDGQGVTEARVGLMRELLNPVVGLAGLHLEAYGGGRDTRVDGGIRARLVSPFARLAIGVDYNAVDRSADFLLSVFNSGRRGGLFRDGSVLRVDFVPARDQQLSIGIEKPIARRIPMGRTRPRQDHVALPRRGTPPGPRPPASTELRVALESVRESAEWIRRATVPFLDYDGPDRRAAERRTSEALRHLDLFLSATDSAGNTRTVEQEARRLHATLESAFTIAAAATATGPASGSEQLGRLAAAEARSILLSDVLLPYNRLLGQQKSPDTIDPLATIAAGRFARWLRVQGLADSAADAMAGVFTAVLGVVESSRAASRRDWGDARFVWLPLQYALLPEDHDTQGELDALVARAVGQAFTEGNFVSYVINEQFQYQLSRTIRQAEDYHVLWTHDVRGVDGVGNPDEMSFRHVLRSYLAALTERVRAYDRTGKFPVYIVLLDQWFYEVNDARRWMSVLEDPTRHRVRLPGGFTAWEDSLEAAQDTLRQAIAASSLLQAQKRLYGAKWLRNLVKVHVNITNPSDASFWSWRVARYVSLPDNIMRDHRKLVFYDLTEADPYRGEALYTGAGVGEHYANLSWEDRSLLVRGPAALGLKTAAREALLGQGIPAEQIPYPLQPRPPGRDYDVRIHAAEREGRHPLRALGLQNGTGFDRKEINVAKAVLYTLMPSGSVVKIPDSLWNAAFWGSAMVGCALRGVRVLIIAPSYANAPARAFGSMARAHELLYRLILASRELGPRIAATGGLLRVGLYSSDLAVTDIPGKVNAVRRTFASEPWLRDLFGFPPSVYADLADLGTAFAGLAMAPAAAVEFESDPRPQLHLKANFLASREAWSLMARPEWVAMTWEFVQARIAQVQTRPAAVASFEAFPDAIIDVGGGVVQDWFDRLDPATRERVVFYTMLGSQNQNARSLVVDGEDAFVVSNWPSVIPYLDFISLVGQSRWLQDPADLDRLLPPPSEWKRRLARRFAVQF